MFNPPPPPQKKITLKKKRYFDSKLIDVPDAIKPDRKKKRWQR